MTTAQTLPRRTGAILNRKFRKYLLPMTAVGIAISLDEFVDSILVANLLGAEAMTLVNLSGPITLMVAVLYYLFGVGGSVLYALFVGARETDKAGKVFTLAFGGGLALSLLLSLLGQLFPEELCRLLCPDDTLLMQLVPYVRVLLYSAPLIVCVQTIAMFLPAAGRPGLSTLLSVTANAVNLVCDYVYLKFFHMGAEGAAWATFTGYVLCCIILLVLFCKKKVRLHAALPMPRDFRLLKSVAAQGSANAFGQQLGFVLKFTFFNRIALSLGGTVALQIFALCIQVISIMSIALYGVGCTAEPLTATLKGQRDTNGIRYIVYRAQLFCWLVSAILSVLFLLFPGILFWMFNITDPAVLQAAPTAIRIFLVTFFFRCLYILFMEYVRIIGYKLYAFLIGVCDGYLLLIPVALVTTGLFGTTGIWLSFPITSVLIFLSVLVCNRRLARRSDGRLYGPFLLERETDAAVCDMTVSEEDESISDMSLALTEFCASHGVAHSTAARVGLIAEEMAVYIRSHRKKDEQIDILTRIEDGAVTMDFRSEGTPFDPLADAADDIPENILFLRKLPEKIVYDYILGMNSTRLTVPFQAE